MLPHELGSAEAGIPSGQRVLQQLRWRFARYGDWIHIIPARRATKQDLIQSMAARFA